MENNVQTRISIPDMIIKKRNGGELSNEEIHAFIETVCSKTIQPTQIGAMLMAMFFNPLTFNETISMTSAMTNSGKVLTWPDVNNDLVIDKHSTGGVGDKISIFLSPALAACGLKNPMISGRGLALTGGTLDKLECIPGFNVTQTPQRIAEIVNEIGCVIVGQSEEMVVADKIIYSIRDVTGTVDCPPLIFSSILSKKLAEGIKTLVLDVKVGDGFNVGDLDAAEKFSDTILRITSKLDLKCACLLTRMENPLGSTVGNALEIKECLEILKGNFNPSSDMMKVFFNLGTILLQSSQLEQDEEKCELLLKNVLINGSALKKFERMIQCLGVSKETAESLCDFSNHEYPELKKADIKTDILSNSNGIVTSIDAIAIAELVKEHGGGRFKSDDIIQQGSGIEIFHHVGTQVKKDDILATFHSNVPLSTEEIAKITTAFVINSDISDYSIPNVIIKKKLNY